MSDFLSEFLNRRGSNEDARKRTNRGKKPNTIKFDRYDRRTLEQTAESFREFEVERRRMGDVVERAMDLSADVFHMLHKVYPDDEPYEQIREENLIHAYVRDRLKHTSELEELRGAGTIGDPIHAAQGFMQMRKAIEAATDRVRAEMDRANKVRELMEDLARTQQEQATAEDAVRDLQEQVEAEQRDTRPIQGPPEPGWDSGEGQGGEPDPDSVEPNWMERPPSDGEGESEGEAAAADGSGDQGESQGQGQGQEGQQQGQQQGQSSSSQSSGSGNGRSASEQLMGAQAQAEALGQQASNLEDAIEKAKSSLEKALNRATPDVDAALRKGAREAVENQREMNELANNWSWGTDAGARKHMDALERMKLANRLKESTKLHKISSLIGRFKRVALSETRKDAPDARSDIRDVEVGDDLTRLLPHELINMTNPNLEMDFLVRYTERQLQQFKMGGDEKAGLGPIICGIDGSGSMSGTREIWAKAVALALMHIAKDQKRSFTGMHFGSSHELDLFEFRQSEDFELERVIQFAELFYGGGTDFQTPLSAGVDIMRRDYERHKHMKGDMVFITDGACAVRDDWLEKFKEEQERLGFHVFGVMVGGSRIPDVLEKICDGRVIEVKDLTSPEDMRPVFNGLHRPTE